MEQDTQVCLHGLVDRPELNGRCGTVQRWNSHANRWTIELSAHGGVVRVHECNIQWSGPPMAGARHRAASEAMAAGLAGADVEMGDAPAGAEGERWARAAA